MAREVEYDTKEKISKLFDTDPEFARYVEENPVQLPPIENIPAMRAMRNQMEEWMNDRYTSNTQSIPMRDDHQNEVRIFRPEDAKENGALIVLVHAGGFAMGTTRQLSPFAQGFTKLFGATVVCVTHRLAPECVFPAAANDVQDALKWAAGNAAALGADTEKGFVLGGVSSGANLAAVVAQQWIEQGLTPAMTGVWTCMPCLLDKEILPKKYADVFFSREQAQNATLVDTDNLYGVINNSKPDVHSPLWSPFNATTPHVGMPPVFVQVSGADPMRDDGLIYERALREAGVKTKLNVYPGVPHWHFGFFPSLQASKQANIDAGEGVAWLLGKDTGGVDILEAMSPPW